jgi:hypothetical protein
MGPGRARTAVAVAVGVGAVASGGFAIHMSQRGRIPPPDPASGFADRFTDPSR